MERVKEKVEERVKRKIEKITGWSDIKAKEFAKLLVEDAIILNEFPQFPFRFLEKFAGKKVPLSMLKKSYEQVIDEFLRKIEEGEEKDIALQEALATINLISSKI